MKRIEFEMKSQRSHPSIGEPAPQFDVPSSHGAISLKDYRGSWVILMSQPYDFCPAIPYEEKQFAEAYRKLKGMKCEFLGMGGADNLLPVLWCESVRQQLGLKSWFPILSDIDSKLAKTYGMILTQNGESLLNHSIYIIDDKQVLRAIVYYEATAPGTLDELVRLVELLQHSDAQGVVTHENWRPGDEWILVPDKHSGSPTTPSRGRNYSQDLWYF